LRTVDPATPGGFPIIGTADDCIQALRTYQQEARVTDLALGMHLPGLAPERLRQSMTLFAREVMPHFK
jgi:alkanesulfonate monooxygenase SsuD/methylene tetrahydromethanopterin reductase-like flavin-dependent oxidoreductase (luciferase family)